MAMALLMTLAMALAMAFAIGHGHRPSAIAMGKGPILPSPSQPSEPAAPSPIVQRLYSHKTAALRAAVEKLTTRRPHDEKLGEVSAAAGLSHSVPLPSSTPNLTHSFPPSLSNFQVKAESVKKTVAALLDSLPAAAKADLLKSL